MYSRLRHVSPRHIWVASWLLAGALVLMGALVTGALPVEALLGLYFGLGAGVELTLFILGRRVGPPPTPASPPLPQGQDGEEIIAALRALGYSWREARRAAQNAPVGLPLEQRLREVLKQKGGGL